MKILTAILLSVALFFLACKKEDNPNKYGCVWGKNKTTLVREFIRCGHRDIFGAGNNQNAADKIAIDLGITKENVVIMNQYTNWEFIPNENCSCQ